MPECNDYICIQLFGLVIAPAPSFYFAGATAKTHLVAEVLKYKLDQQNPVQSSLRPAWMGFFNTQ